MTPDRDEERGRKRLEYKPERVRWLLVTEAPPEEPERFFYSEHLHDHNHLYLETMKVLFPETSIEELKKRKSDFLGRFKDGGFYQIEVLDEPIPLSMPAEERREIVRAYRGNLINRIRQISSQNTSVILIKPSVYELREPLIRAGIKVINRGMIAFPSPGNQAQFRSKMAGLLEPYLRECAG